MSVCGYVHVNAGALRVQERGLDLQEPELQVFVSCWLWVLEFGSLSCNSSICWKLQVTAPAPLQGVTLLPR